MASTWPPVKSNTGVNVCKLVAKLLHHDTVLADLLGELMDCHCLIDRSSIASGNILVIHGDPRKVADVIHKVVDETDVKADENDKEVLTVLDSFKERFHSQFETDFEQDNSTFKAAFHRKISDEVKPSILSLTNKDGRLPLSRHQLSYLHCHLDHLREQVRTSWPESAVIINVQNEAKGQGVLVVSSKRHDFQSVINFLNLFMANIKTSSKELDASRALFLSGVKGQRDVMRLQKEHQCQISVILPGHQVLLRAESPTGHRLFLCEGNMAATDCNMLVLPFSENQSGWTATQKRVLDRGLLTTKTELYTNWIGSPPKKRTLILRCPTPEAGETVMLVHLSDPTGGPSSGAEALTQELAQELSKGLAEAVRISEPRGEFIAVPVAMSTRQSLSDNLEFILPVIQDYLAKEVISATVVLYLEKLSVSEKQKLVETLEKRINQNWKVQTDGAAVYEDNFSSPKLVVAGKMKDIETTFSKLQSLDVPSDFQKRACLLNSTNKPRQVRRSPTQESEAVAEDNKDIGKEDDVRTVCVDGLTADDGELCQMYFQNNEQSGGGQLAQKTVVWDDDTQCWMITFEQRDVAARVASRQHTINGQPVDVKLVYTPRVSYPDRLLFHNVSESISRDYLTLYLERITGQEVTDLMYADKAGDVIVVLDEEPDFTQVQKMCRQKKLEGQKLWVSRVPVSNCILLENLSEATSEDTVMYYFSNKRSGGGPVEKVVFQSEQRKCLVFFYNHEVIENILGKTHALDGSQLQVRLYTECLGPSGGRRDASPFTLPSRVEFKDVDKYKMVFIRQSAALQQRLVELLTDLHAKVISADNPLSVECTLTTAVPHASQLAASWTKDVQDAVNSVINMVVVLHQEVMQDVWTETEKAVSAIKPTSKDSALILVLAENRKFIVMGVKNMADELMKQVKQIVTQKEEEAERKKQEVTETRKLKPFQLHLLTDMSFQSEVAKRHPALKVEICIEKGEISYQGLIRDVREAQVEMYELLMAVRSERHTMSNLQKTILSAKGAPDYVVHKFHVDKLEAGEELLPSAQVEDILANPQSSLCYKSKIQSQEVAELSADRERASARECRRQNDDRTQKNDVNDMELASEDRKEIHDEFDMIDEDYIDKVIGKLENPQPDCWLQRSSSSMMQSPSLLDTDVPSYQETGSLSLSHPEDCILNSENPRLGMTPITRLPELPQEQVPHIQGMIVPDVISTHKSSTSEHHYFSSPVPVHPFSNVINIEVQEEESCPQVLSVAEPIWTESAMKIPPQQGMQNEIYPNINEEEEESSFSLVQEAEKPLLSSVEAGEELLPSAQIEDILANPQSSLCYKSKIKSQEVAELSADREHASARECRRQNDDRTQKNDVNDMELASDDRKERHEDEDRMRRINSSSQSGDCCTQISICKQTSDQQFMLNLKEEENVGTRSKPKDDSLLKMGERQPRIEDEVERSNGSTQSCDRASQTTATQLDWEQFKIHERKSEDYDWSSDENGSMQSEHDDYSSEEDNNTEPLQESATDTASEDQLNYFFGYDDDDEMPTDVCPPKSTVPVSSFSVSESSNVASLKHSCEGRMADIENSSGSKTNDEDFDYHLQNSTGLTEDSLVQRHKGRARCKPTLKLKLHLKGMSCASENMVNKRTKNGLLLRDQNWSPEEQYEEKDTGSENAVVSRHTATDDLQEHSQSSFAGEQNSQKAITTRAEQLIPVKVLLCGQSVSSVIPPSQPLPIKTQSLKLSTGSTQTLLSSTVVNKTRSPCHRQAEEQSEKRQEQNIGKAHEDNRENYSQKGQVLNVRKKENKWNVGESVKAQQEKRNCRGDNDDEDVESMNMDNCFDKVEKEKKLCSNGKEIGDINKNNIYKEKGFDNENNMRKLRNHQDTDNDERDEEEEQKESGDKQNSDDERDEENEKESGDKQNSDDERDEENEQKELDDDENSDGEMEKECLTKARDNQYTDDKDRYVRQREVREDHNSQGEEKENKEEIGDGEEDKTVCVTGLTAGDEEVCQLYFENTKRSGGGNIAQQGCVWDEMANQFLITFVDRQAAHRVLKRSHTIVNRDIQVKQYVPPPCFKDTVLVTGIPQGTSADCLQTFLESVADMALDIVQMNKAEGKAIVSLADEEADLDHVKHLQQACQKNPLYGHAVLSVQRIPLSHTVLVDNLNPKTKESAILYFFSNKNRNSGGPVTHIKRLNSTSALVHFENYKDAQALVDKGSHILDEFPLKVSLHLDCFPLTAEVTEEKADYCSSLLTGEGVPSIHKENDYENQTQGDQHHLASDEIPLYDHGVGSCEVTEQVQGGSSFHREPSPMERHSRGSSEWKNDRHASYRPDRRWEQHCGSHISQPHWQQPDCFKRHTAFNSPGPSATHLRTSAYRPTPCKFDRGVRVENNRNLHCPLRQQTEYPHVIKKLGSDVVDRFRENKEALRHLATDLRQIHGRFQWKLPGCIDVIALTSDIPEDWCEQVTKKLEKHLIEVNLGKGRNPLPVERESQRLKRLAEGGVDCKEMPIRQIKDQHSDVDLTHTSVTERYRAAMQNRLETESMEILKEKPYTFFEEVIPNVKACQIKVMSKPQVLSIFKEKCKSITLLVDKEKSLVKVRVNTSQYDAMKMKAHVMEFMTKISERYLSRDYMGNKDDKVEANLP